MRSSCTAWRPAATRATAAGRSRRRRYEEGGQDRRHRHGSLQGRPRSDRGVPHDVLRQGPRVVRRRRPEGSPEDRRVSVRRRRPPVARWSRSPTRPRSPRSRSSSPVIRAGCARCRPVASKRSLGALRVEIGGLISVGSNTSENLSKQQRNDLPGPGQLVPARPRRRRLRADVDALLHARRRRRAPLPRPDRDRRRSTRTRRPIARRASSTTGCRRTSREAFANVEIQYRKKGETAVRVHRHIGWNLSDDYLEQAPRSSSSTSSPRARSRC